MSLFQQQRAQAKEHIFNKSVELFKENGYENVSVDLITKTVGIAKGGFYNFFPSKRDILMLWAEREFQKYDFAGIVKKNLSIERNLYELIKFLVKSIDENFKMFKAFLNEHVKIHGMEQTSDGKFDFIFIFSMIIRQSSDFDKIGEAYFKEKIEVLNNSLFMALINWFNKAETVEGLEHCLTNIVKVCIYGIKEKMGD